MVRRLFPGALVEYSSDLAGALRETCQLVRDPDVRIIHEATFSHGSIPIAVYDHKHTGKWGDAFHFVAGGRASNLHLANYKEGSDLINFLTMAVRSLAKRIAVSASSYQG